MKRGLFLLLVFAIVFSAFASASFTLGNLSDNINTNYAPGESIYGWINLSFSNAPSDAIISTNFGGSISVSELLNVSNAQYECNPLNCGDNYEAIDGQSSKIFSLGEGESKTLSFRIDGSINSIEGLSFKINSSANQSCISPLKIDLFADNKIDWENKKSAGIFSCYENGGCFDYFSELTEYNLGEKPYCEKVELIPAPAYKIGAWVRKGDGSYINGMIKMQIYSITNQLLAECELPSPSDSGSEIGCVVNYSVGSNGDYYVCVRGKAGMVNYKIRGESESPCGFFDSFKGAYTNDYNIFAKSGKYDKIAPFEYNASIFSQYSSGTLSNYINNYIISRYNKDCAEGCSIPIKFSSGTSQSVKISDISLQYTITEGGLTSNDIFDVDYSPANINSGFLILDLEKFGFKAPQEYGENTLIISLNGEKILEKQINTIKKPIINGISPEGVFAAVSTTFYVYVESPDNKSITKYKWDFGDGEVRETSINSVQHAYNSTGLYSLVLTVYDSAGLSAEKTFTIESGNPKEIINSTIIEKKRWLNNLTSQLNLMDSWKAERIKAEMNITNVQSTLTKLETEYLSAGSESSYVSIMNRLNSLKIPSSIEKANVDSIPFVLVFKNIDKDKLKFLGAGSYQEGSYDSAIKNWFEDNMNGEISSESTVFNYPSGKEVLITFFNISLKEKEDTGETYLVVNGESNFKENAIDLTNAKGLKIEGSREVEFSKKGLISAGDLEAYLSPKFSKIPLVVKICDDDGTCDKENGETKDNCDDCKTSYWWVLWIFIIIFLGAAGYYVFKKGWIKLRGKEKRDDENNPWSRKNNREENANQNTQSTGFRSGFKPFKE